MEKDAPTGLPQYFLIEAQLLDAASKPVSPLCTDRSHTQAYQAFASKTPEDYPADQVLDFGDDGFAVLPKGTQRAGVAEKTAGGYAVPAMTALPSPGDIVALTLNGATVPVKVKSASVQGGKTIIVPDGDASLAELYDSLRVDVSVDLGGAASGQALSAKSGGEGGAAENGVELWTDGLAAAGAGLRPPPLHYGAPGGVRGNLPALFGAGRARRGIYPRAVSAGCGVISFCIVFI